MRALNFGSYVVLPTLLICFSTAPASAACGWRKPGDCVKKAAEVIVVATTPSVVVDVVTGKKPGETAEQVTHEAGKVVKHVGAESGRAVGNLAEAGLAIGRYIDRQGRGYQKVFTDAQRRLIEGKVVDAFWHLGTDPIRNQEQNAAKAAQESSLLNTVGATAAQAYGGPAGAAAYASWYTYRATGDADMALRVGVLSALTSSAMGQSGKLPDGTADQLAQKAIVTGAIGGLAVAAAGGDREAVEKGFLLSGGMVLVQGVYKDAVGQGLDARASEGEPYCMATLMAECSPEVSAYNRDGNGNIIFQDDGTPSVDVRKTDIRRPHVGTWAKAGEHGLGQETGPLMTGVSKVPGMNAMSVLHDHWALSWNMDSFTTKISIVPAVVVTYIGTGAPFDNHLTEVAIRDSKKIAEPGVPVDTAERDEGALLNDSAIKDALRFAGGNNTSAVPNGQVRPVSLWLDLPSAQYAQIRQVKYEFNHPTFKSPKIAQEGGPLFPVRWKGYGCITDARVVATLANGKQLNVPFDLCQLWEKGSYDPA